MLKINLFLLITLLSFGFYAQQYEQDNTHRTIVLQQTDVVAENFVAEIDLGTEFKVITANSNKRHRDINLAKEEAYFNAIVDNQIDVLVDPIYTIKKRGRILFFFGGYVEAKVVGFAGYYKNVLTESHANAIKFDEYLNDFIDFLALNTKPMAEREEDINTILNDLSSKDFKENSKTITVNSTLESFIDRYEKSKSIK
jgi:hypothetical protein